VVGGGADKHQPQDGALEVGHADINHKVGDISRKIGALEVGQVDISRKVGALEVGQADINRKFGILLELEVQKHASRIFGDDFASQFTATFILDLVQLLPKDFVFMSDSSRMSRANLHILYMAAVRKQPWCC
jgi:hypothetical protein